MLHGNLGQEALESAPLVGRPAALPLVVVDDHDARPLVPPSSHTLGRSASVRVMHRSDAVLYACHHRLVNGYADRYQSCPDFGVGRGLSLAPMAAVPVGPVTEAG